MQRKKNRIGFGERFYRRIAKPKGLVQFSVTIKETDLWISARRNLKKEAEHLILDARNQIESYIKLYPEFLYTLLPWSEDPLAPPVVLQMIQAAKKANVGPMASVAGAIADYVGRGLLRLSSDVIVENGGDVFLNLKRDVHVGLFSGNKYEIGVLIKKDMMPAGICSSSGKIGHSLSFGNADIVTIISHSAAISDASATSIANRIKEKKDIREIGRWASQMDGIIGAIAIFNGDISIWGDIEICPV